MPNNGDVSAQMTVEETPPRPAECIDEALRRLVLEAVVSHFRHRYSLKIDQEVPSQGSQDYHRSAQHTPQVSQQAHLFQPPSTGIATRVCPTLASGTPPYHQ